MKKTHKLVALLLTIIISFSSVCASVFAKDFAPVFDINNPGIRTQYIYSENKVSWLRKLVVKEDMLSSEGIITEETLYPVTDYPYTTDAPNFKEEVGECIKTYTLDEDSQRAAYLYLLETVGALTIISEPNVSDETKADWLRKQGIIITEEDEKDPDKLLMISALYAMMRNDLYYVYKGEHLTIPKGTPLEEAVVIYLSALSGQNTLLSKFISKFFGSGSLGNLEDYMYYTSLMALYTNGYVSATEVTRISREEVYKRVAIMTIRNYGISIDSEKASTEEIRHKYLTAMLGTHFKVKLDPESLEKSKFKNTIPFYVLQRMAYEDVNLTISQTKYSYEECFEKVLVNTDRFDLENEFFADIYEYNVYLDNNRTKIYVSPTPVNAASVVTINGTIVPSGSYAEIALKNVEHQIINLVSKYTVNGKTTTSSYKLNIFQGTKPPADSDLTGIIPTYGPGTTKPNEGTGSGGSSGSQGTGNGAGAGVGNNGLTATLPNLGNVISGFNGSATNLLGQIFTFNDKGQLVDQQGNILSPNVLETLPVGYTYVKGEDGSIKIVLIDDTTTEPTTDTANKKAEEDPTRKTIVIVSLVACIALIIALIATMVLTKKNKGMSKKEKERAKKTKKEARDLKKEQKKKK